MGIHTGIATAGEQSECAASSASGGSMLGSLEPGRRMCPISGVPLTGRQRSACSLRHRAALRRRHRVPFPWPR